MTKKQFWIGVACLYGIGLAVALSIAASPDETYRMDGRSSKVRQLGDIRR
jgi:hypothetical protein